MHLSFGEFDWPDGHSESQFVRGEWMEVVARDAPHVFLDLGGEPLELLGKLNKTARNWSWTQIVNNSNKKTSAFLESLMAWSERWNLDAEWIRSGAYETLRKSLQATPPSSPIGFPFHVSFPSRRDLSETLPAPNGFEGEYWPLIQSRSDYLTGQREDILKKITADPCLSWGEASRRNDFIKSIVEKLIPYCKEVEQHLEQQGYVRATSRRGKRNLYKHVEWAVSFQVGRNGWSKIANQAGVRVSAVKSAVESILTLIDLPMREIPKGRPPGSKESVKAKTLRYLGRR